MSTKTGNQKKKVLSKSSSSLEKIKSPKDRKKSILAPAKSDQKRLKKSKKQKPEPTIVTKENWNVNTASEEEEEEVDAEIEELQQKLHVNASDVNKAVRGIIKFTSENPRLKNQLFNEQFPLYLQLNSIKVANDYQRILRIPLKNSLVTPDSEVCLIVPDVKGVPNKDHDRHLEHYEELLRKRGVDNIKKIMTFHEFRTEYETFELRRRLVELYDVFLVDGRISGKVVRKCGKIFYDKRKVPTAIKLQATKLKEHINQALTKTPLYLHSRGDSYMVRFGFSNMPVTKLVENVFSILKVLDKEFPGGMANLRNINVSTHRGLSMPVYETLKNQNLVKVPKVKATKSKLEPVTGELSTRLNAEVLVKPTGEVIVSKIETPKSEDNEGEEEETSGDENIKVEKKKKKKGPKEGDSLGSKNVKREKIKKHNKKVLSEDNQIEESKTSEDENKNVKDKKKKNGPKKGDSPGNKNVGTKTENSKEDVNVYVKLDKIKKHAKKVQNKEVSSEDNQAEEESKPRSDEKKNVIKKKNKGPKEGVSPVKVEVINGKEEKIEKQSKKVQDKEVSFEDNRVEKSKPIKGLKKKSRATLESSEEIVAETKRKGTREVTANDKRREEKSPVKKKRRRTLEIIESGEIIVEDRSFIGLNQIY